jgi:Tol biopolymer transport system component
MTHTAILLLSLLGAWIWPAANVAGPERRLAYERDTYVWVAALDGTAPKRIARGQAPELSPDGTRLAYNTVQPTGQPAHRQIAIFDFAAGTTTILEKVPSTNAMTPRWSPAWDCAWLDAPDSILFLSQARGETTPSIFRMTTNGKGADRKLLVRNARTPSASGSK